MATSEFMLYYAMPALAAALAVAVTVKLAHDKLGAPAWVRACLGRVHDARMTLAFEKGMSASPSWQATYAELNDTAVIDDGNAGAKVHKSEDARAEIDGRLAEAAESLCAAAGMGDNAQLATNVTLCLRDIVALASLRRAVERERAQSFDTGNPAHEAQLEELWTLMVPAEPFPERKGPHWDVLGFQGKDPITDFRGMGLLALHSLMYFARTYPREAQSLLAGSHHPNHGYSYAITMINMTAMACDLLKKGDLNGHFYALSRAQYELDDFLDVCVYFMEDFHKLWMSERPENCMAFPRIKSLFQEQMAKKLESGMSLPLAHKSDDDGDQ